MADDRIPHHDKLLALLLPVYQRVQLSARRLCRSDAEGDDLFQDAVLRALTRLGDLRDDQAFPAWFYRILLSLHRTRRRRDFWRRLVPIDAAIESLGEPVGEDGRQWEDLRVGAARARAALAILPAVQREAVVLFDIDGYSLAEVAAMQNASLSAVKTRLLRGRARLEEFYTSRAAHRERSPEKASSPCAGAERHTP